MQHAFVPERISEKIEKRGVRLAPPLPEAMVAEFERRWSVKLPTDYRRFILEIGQSGDGPPEYGICRLGDVPQDFGEPLPDVSCPFPFTSPWVWEDGDPSPEGGVADSRRGIVVLGSDGCGQFWVLVVQGPSFGEVWMITDVGVAPLEPRIGFAEWYEEWLNGKRDWWS